MIKTLCPETPLRILLAFISIWEMFLIKEECEK